MAKRRRRATGPRVLIVDDDRASREMYRAFLTYTGCIVTTASDGKRAIDQAHRTHPDVIVMDLLMPRLDGWTASKWLKGSPTTAHIPIIALSAVLNTRAHARAIGFDAFLAKPCPPDLLWWEIKALLD